MIFLPECLLGWEWCIRLLFVDDLLSLSLYVLLLEVRQKAIPVLVCELRVLGQLTLYHQLLDIIDRVNIFHGVNYDFTHVFQRFEVAHRSDGVTLDKDVALG